MIKSFIFISSWLSLFFFTVSLAQDYPSKNEKNESPFSLMGLGTGELSQVKTLKPEQMLISSVDEEEYIVDAGDVFIIKIDVKGPALKIFNTIVTPNGYLVIPDAPTIEVGKLNLRTATEKINDILRKNFPNAMVESHLYQVHPLRVTVLGALPRPGKLNLISSDRLFDGIAGTLNPMMADSTLRFDWNIMSLRNVELRRKDNEKQSFDLLKYKLTGDRSQNPYLMDEDILFINFKDSSRSIISVKGAIGMPIDFEYKNGDRLMIALQFASNLLPQADSTRIELVRFNEENKTIENYILAVPADTSFLLKSDDRIFVREKIQYHRKYSVIINGEVKYPGEYAIENGKTYLSDVLQQAGGFLDNASLIKAKVERIKEQAKDKTELERLQGINLNVRNQEEASYSRLRSRENRYIVSADFANLSSSDNSGDVLLFDGDIITVPERSLNVFVSGGVITPGYIAFNPDWNFENYIQAAGGYSEYAKDSWVSIIDSRTGKWKDATEEMPVNEGDIVFVPEKDKRDWYQYFLDGLAITAQISAIIVVIVTLAK